ncbi:MAG: MAPEG family protein [Pseudomonadota bacterium]
MLLTTTLCLGAAALVVNFWLTMRIGRLRGKTGISVGDGGNELLLRRIRAQLNFAEQFPLTLLLVGLVELAGQGGAWLAPLGALFILGRVAHAIGMDGAFRPGRPIGMVTGIVLQLALVIAAVVASLGRF